MIIKTEDDLRFAQSRFKELQNKLRNKYSPSEYKFAELLFKAGLYFTREKTNIAMDTRWCYYDFFIPSLNLFIEIDGPEHQLPEKRLIDHDKVRIAESKDCLNFVIRFTNDEVYAMSTLDYTTILKRMSETEKVNSNLRYIAWWLHRQIDGYDIMKRNRIRQFGKVMTRPIFMYDREINTIMKFESVFDLHNYTRIKCRDIIGKLNSQHATKRSNGRYAFADDIMVLSRKMDFIWSEKLPYDDITLREVKPFKNDLEKCLDLVHSGAIGPYPRKRGTNINLADLERKIELKLKTNK